MVQYHSRRNPVYCYLLILAVCAFFVSIYKFPDTLDIIRYYENAKESVSSYHSTLDYLLFQIEYNVDFIYTTLLYIFRKNGVPLNILTILFVAIYYSYIAKTCRYQYPKFSGFNHIYIYALLMCVPLDWILSISRTTAAFAFFYVAIFNLLKKKKVGYIWLLVSLFTHIQMALYLLVLLVAFVFSKLKIRKKFKIIVLILVVGISLFPEYFVDDVSRLFGLVGGDLRYGEVYSTLLADTDSLLKASRIDTGSKMGGVLVYLFSIYLVLTDDRDDVMSWYLYICTLMLCFFFFSSIMMVNRIEMILPLFLGLGLFSKLENPKTKAFHKNVIKIFAVMSFFTFATVLYCARNIFF